MTSPHVQTVTVTEDEADTRLDRWFRRHYPDVNQGRLQKLLRTGQIRLDGKRAQSATRLAAGQQVRVPPLGDAQSVTAARPRPASRIDEREAEALRRRILFRDDWVIVIDKPAGLAVQGGTGTARHLDGMLDALSFGAERPRLVHRLDKETSGVMVLARTAQAARRLSDAFRGRATRKYYWAVTVGVPDPDKGRIDAPLAKLPGPAGERMAEDREDGKAAATLYAIVDRAHRQAAWVALWPLTGRTHQLRAHMAAIGTPILGDAKYGAAAGPSQLAEVGHGLHLHARRLIVPHPSGRGKIDVTAPLPPHMRETWRYFGFASNDDGDPFAEIQS